MTQINNLVNKISELHKKEAYTDEYIDTLQLLNLYGYTVSRCIRTNKIYIDNWKQHRHYVREL